MNKYLHCIVCNRTSFSLLYETKDRMFEIPGHFNIKQCSHCGLTFLSPQPSKQILKRHYPHKKYYSYKTEVKGLSGLISKLRSYLIKHYYNPTIISFMFSLFIKGVPAIPNKPTGKSRKILDVGCGSGKTLALLKKIGWDVYGLEIDKSAVDIAKQRGLENVKLGDYSKMTSFPDNYFDCIRLYHVIEHLHNPGKSLKLIYKKLKPGGEIILGTPNSESLVSKIFGKFWYHLDAPRHLFIYSPKTLSRIAEKEGFSNISLVYCSSDGLGRSLIYTINELFRIKLDTNKFTFLFIVFYPIEWILDKLKTGDIIILRGIKKQLQFNL